MRALRFFIYLGFFLLCGVHSHGAIAHLTHGTFASKDSLTKSRPIKYTNKGQNTLLVEDNDLDFEEEYFGNNIKDTVAFKLLSENTNLGERWYSKLSYWSFLNQFNKGFITIPNLCGLSNPIYIAQRNLRI